MELNISSFNNTISKVGNGNQEIYAQEDLSFEADQENLNTSSSSDHFETPSAKFIYDQLSNRKQPSQNIRQTLFQNLDPLNESNLQNKSQQNQTFNVLNNSLDSTICIENKTAINKTQLDDTYQLNNDTFQMNRTISNENNIVVNLNNDCVMDLSNYQSKSDAQHSNNGTNRHYEEMLKEKDLDNEKLKNYVEQLNELNKNLSEAILTVQDKFEVTLNEKNAIIQGLNLQNNVLVKEKKLAVEDVQGLENSFSELHRRYEKLKLTLESCKKKEEMFQEECLAFSEKLEESQRLNNEYKQRLELLENERNNIVETIRKQSEKEIISLKAQLKKAEMRYNGLTNQLEQKTQENLELNKMIDELTK